MCVAFWYICKLWLKHFFLNASEVLLLTSAGFFRIRSTGQIHLDFTWLCSIYQEPAIFNAFFTDNTLVCEESVENCGGRHCCYLSYSDDPKLTAVYGISFFMVQEKQKYILQ